MHQPRSEVGNDQANAVTLPSRSSSSQSARFSVAREKNRRLNLVEYEKGKVELQSQPRYVSVELTQGCNLQCEMCRSRRIGVTASRLSKTLFCRVAEKLFPTAELVDLRGWGESLLLPDIIEVIRYTSNFGCAIRFVTNLSFRRKEVLDALAEHNCYLAVSVDSAEDDILPKLRHGASLTNIRSNLLSLVKRYRELHGNADRIVLNCTVQRPALPTLSSLVGFAVEVGVAEIRLAGVSAANKPHLSLCGQDKAVDVALQSLGTAARRHGIRVIATTHFAGLPENRPGISSCIRPWSFACVNVDGLVGFCDHLIGPFARKYLIGDLRISGIDEIWNSHRWKEVRQEHWGPRRAVAELFTHCDWCYRKRFVEFEDLFYPRLASLKVKIPDHQPGCYEH